MTKLIGDAKPEPEALAQMRERGGEWFAYQNMDLGSRDIGHLTFLKVGPGQTFVTPPERRPDFPGGSLGWRYLLVGKVDLETGEIREVVAR
jgi:hypothetical protein